MIREVTTDDLEARYGIGWGTIHRLANRIETGTATEADNGRAAWTVSCGTTEFNTAHEWLYRTAASCDAANKVDASATAVGVVARGRYGPNWSGFLKMVSDTTRAVALYELLPKTERTPEAVVHFQTLIAPAVTAGWLNADGSITQVG